MKIAVGTLVVLALLALGLWLRSRSTGQEPREDELKDAEQRLRASLDAARRAPLKGMDTSPVRSSAVSFGYKGKWLAIKTASPERVIEALGLRDVRRTNWKYGVSAGYAGDFFVTPPVDGWVLVLSSSLPSPETREGEPELALPLLKDLSRRLETVVQCFATHRVVEYHSWVWSERGEIKRAYGYIGESGRTFLDVGSRTPEEEAVGDFFDERSPESKKEGYRERKDLKYPSEDEVMAVAGKWSVDPSQLSGRKSEVEPGWVGRRPE